MSHCIVYSTFETEEQAAAAASHLLEEGLIACANIIPGAKSLYKWKGKIEVSGEVIMICKTKSELFGRVNEKICKLHDYDTPCVLKLDISAGNDKFLTWLESEIAF